MRTQHVLVVVGTALLLGGIACGDCGSPPEQDAALDTTPFETGPDTQRDAPLDVLNDSPTDSSDGDVEGPDFVSAGIRDCSAEVARNPSALPSYEFEPCFDGRPSCRQLVVGWGNSEERGVYVPHTSAFGGRGRPTLAVQRVDGLRRRMDVYFPDSGQVVGAFRYAPSSSDPHECFLGVPLAVHEDRFAFSVTPYRYTEANVNSVVVVGRWPDMIEQRVDLTDELIAENFVASVGLGTGHISIRLSPGSRIGLLDDRTYRAVAPSDALPGASSRQYAVGDHVVYLRTEADQRVLAIAHRDDGVPQAYLGTAERTAFAFASDGEWIAWGEASGETSRRQYTERTVHVARFEPNAEDLEIIRSVDIGSGGVFFDLVVGGGRVAIPARDVTTGRSAIRVVRFDTGEETLIEPPSEHLLTTAYLTEEEIGIHVLWPTTVPRTLFRITLAD